MRRDKSAAVGLVICFVAMIGIVGAIIFSNYKSKAEGELAKAKEKAQAAQEEKESQITQGNDIQAEIVEKPEEIQVETPVSTPVVEKEDPFSFSENDVLSWPVKGDVVLPYSMDETVYFATLNQYKYNPAIVIAGEIGGDVVSAREGVVTSIKQDAQTGTTVTVSIGDGYEIVYGQIGEVCVEQGETLSKNEIIGYLAEPTKYYSVEGCNLYFQLLKDGEPINPMDFFDV